MKGKTTRPGAAGTERSSQADGREPEQALAAVGPGPAGAPEHGSSDLARIAPAALTAAFEAIAAAAFVVRKPATVLHANARGLALLGSERERVLTALRHDSSSPRVARFPVDGSAEHQVVVLPDIQCDASMRLAALTRRWGLTPRQSAVLALVAKGESNRTVAGQLGCSEKTVELHVSALLAKTRCASRSRLVASFWTDPG